MKQLNNKLRHTLSFFSVLLLVLVLMGVTTEKVEATPLSRWSGASVVDDNTVIDERFTFIPEFKSNTSLTTTGGTWRTTNWSSTDHRKFSTFNIFEGSNSSRKRQDNVFARYKNVGKYNGQEMDLNITVKDWQISASQNKGGNISFEKKKIAVSTSGFDWVYMDWQFVKAGTNTPIQVQGYFTISDVDLRQGVDIHNTTMNAIDRLYVDHGNQLWYKPITLPWHKISTDYSRDIQPDDVYDSRYAFTYTFKHNRMYFRWFTNWGAANRNPRYASKSQAAGEYFIYTDVKPARFDVIPRKFVSHTEMEHPKDTGERIDYDIHFKVPKESTGPNGTYYKSFVFTDTIDPVLDIGDISFYDNDTGAQIANNYFTVKKTGNKVRIEASDWRLTQHHFYNKNYKLRIRATVNKSRLEKVYKDRKTNRYNATNQGHLTINGRLTSSNKVSTNIKKADAPVDPEYKLNVFHKDANTGTTLDSSTTTRSKGYWYNESAKTNLKNSAGKAYKFTRATPTNNKTQTGTLNGNTTLTFYYDVDGTPPPTGSKYSLLIEHREKGTNKLIASDDESGTFNANYYFDVYGVESLTRKGVTYYYSNSTTDNSSLSSNANGMNRWGRLNKDTKITFYYSTGGGPTDPDPEPEYYRLKVEHIDDDTGEMLDSSSRSMVEGSSYSESSKSYLRDNEGNSYSFVRGAPSNRSTQSGTLNSDTTLKFYYKVQYGLTVEHIDMSDNRVITSSSRTMEKGSYYSTSARSDLRKGHNPYIFIKGSPTNSSTQSGTLNGNTVIRYYYKAEYTLTVRHVDEQDDRLITSDTSKFLEGETYYEVSKRNLKDGNYNYKVLDPNVQTGTMTRDTVITFYYRVPELTINNKGIHIYTDLVGSTQPVDIFLASGIKASRKNLTPKDTINDFSGGMVKLSIKDRSNGKVVYSEAKSINNIYNNEYDSEYAINILNNYPGMTKDKKTLYKYEIEVLSEGSNGYRINVGTSHTDTHGWTASEKEIKRNSDAEINYDAVILTEASPGSSVREYKEYVKFDKIENQKLKSGYGYKFEPRLLYYMDTANNAARRVRNRVNMLIDSEPIMNLDDEIVDLSDQYINANKNDNGKKVAAKLSIKSQNLNDSGAKWDKTYQLAKVYLSRKDGRLRYENNDPSLRNVDAGNKMYVPVWIKDLREYSARFESTKPLGANRITFKLDNIVDVYAFMLNHTDSPTTDLDELLLHPMDKNDSLFNWTP